MTTSLARPEPHIAGWHVNPVKQLHDRVVHSHTCRHHLLSTWQRRLLCLPCTGHNKQDTRQGEGWGQTLPEYRCRRLLQCSRQYGVMLCLLRAQAQPAANPNSTAAPTPIEARKCSLLGSVIMPARTTPCGGGAHNTRGRGAVSVQLPAVQCCGTCPTSCRAGRCCLALPCPRQCALLSAGAAQQQLRQTYPHDGCVDGCQRFLIGAAGCVPQCERGCCCCCAVASLLAGADQALKQQLDEADG